MSDTTTITVPRRRRRTRWSYAAGKRGARVSVFVETNGRLYGCARGKKVALRTEGEPAGWVDSPENRARAQAWADDQAEQLRKGLESVADPVPTAAKVLALYETTQTPRKRSRTSRSEDARRAVLWTRFLGAGKDLSRVTLGEWQRFTDLRSAGAIDQRGEPVPEVSTVDGTVRRPRRPVRATAVAHDLLWLRAVIRWATKWRDASGRYLMREDPTRGYDVPVEENPRQPVATTDRYEKLAAVAARVHPMLAALLALAHFSGRRLGAILGLRYSDLRLNEPPHGAVDWPAQTDKMRKRWENIPLHPAARAALDRWLADRPGIGPAYVFPLPWDAERPVGRDLASKWLERAHRLAELPRLDGSLWHAFRRGWATARKRLEVQDVAAAGGWKDYTVLQAIYQQPDAAGVRRAVVEADELREAEA